MTNRELLFDHEQLAAGRCPTARRLASFFIFYSNECHCGNNIIIYVGPSQRQPLILSAGILTPTYG